ncbi:Vacuolar protein sorting-associated protein 26A [Tupaia chinensis]|uniref:Vacuolar protein sorting-associated protein 26A n=1 Tax=Tupaia chinensis TaxID=246437 RepID=L9L4M3_TUPCH|nr:Vacuolar protein sorting-associated protein 26A [Tupaia chinensis]
MTMSFLGGFFGPICEIDVVLNDGETRKMAKMKTEDGKVEKYYIFYDGESVSEKVNLAFKQPGKRLEHQGIRIEFVGQIELFNDKSNTHEFVNLVKELALPGEVTQSRSYDFEFMQVEKPYESYMGANVRLRTAPCSCSCSCSCSCYCYCSCSSCSCSSSSRLSSPLLPAGVPRLGEAQLLPRAAQRDCLSRRVPRFLASVSLQPKGHRRDQGRWSGERSGAQWTPEPGVEKQCFDKARKKKEPVRSETSGASGTPQFAQCDAAARTVHKQHNYQKGDDDESAKSVLPVRLKEPGQVNGIKESERGGANLDLKSSKGQTQLPKCAGRAIPTLYRTF